MPWILLMAQNGATFTEHATDLYPLLLTIIGSLFLVIAWMIRSYITENREAMRNLSAQISENKSNTDESISELREMIRDYIEVSQRRQASFDRRLAVIEFKNGIQSKENGEAA